MFRYSDFGLAIDSEIDLGAPPVDHRGPPDVVIRLGVVPESDARSSVHEEFVRGPVIGAFRIRHGAEIIADPSPGISPGLLRILLTGRLMGYLLRQRGWLPIHASSVQIGEAAVLFVASVGIGKSTAAAGFHARGYAVLSDDVSPVRVDSGSCVLLPGRPRLRLCDDAADVFSALDPDAAIGYDKHDFRLVRHSANQPLPVRRIYLLENGEDFRIEPVSPIQAATAIGKECFVRLRCAGPDMFAAHLRDCASVVATGVVRKLVRPRNLAWLNRMVQLVEADLGVDVSPGVSSARSVSAISA